VGPHGPCASKSRAPRPRYEVADIFRAHGEQYRATHPLTPEQRKVMACIEVCRTEVLGGHVDLCPDCGHASDPSYNSCRNRHCPKCQALDQARWIEARSERILPVPYFHVVFTLPSELGTLALFNRRLIYGLLFTAASKTLLELGRDEDRLGALLGITAVLHTWTRDLRLHPHLHCVVTGGGLALDGEKWVSTGGKFLFPVKVISALFRGKFIDAFKRLHRRGDIDLGPDDRLCTDLPALFNTLFSKPWVVYAKRPFAGPEQVFAYLGRYSHRVAISNHRLQAVTDDAVTFATRDGKSATLKPDEFIRRFLLHVLPKGFAKIRHYGLLASSNVNTKLPVARRLLQPPATANNCAADEHETPPQWQHLLEDLTGIDVTLCPRCGGSRMRRVVLPHHGDPRDLPPPSRAPPRRSP
jgi:hypothetical protein